MVKSDLIIVFVRNPVNHSDRVVKTLPHGATLQECINAFAWSPVHQDYTIAVTIDGSRVDSVDWSLVPDPGASVVFCIVPKFTAIASAIAAWAVSTFAVSAAVATVIYYASMALMYLASYLVSNMIMQASQPGGQGSGSGSGDNSPTYGWGGAQGNYPYQGGAVPVPYGVMRIVPPRIGMFVETSGGKQYLNMLYLVAGCKVDAITGIRINQTAIEQYGQKGLAVYTRLGDADQAPIPFFSEPVDIADRTFNPDTDYDAWQGTTRSDQSIGVKLKHGEWTTRFTDGNTVEGLSVALNCRRGLGNIGKGISAASVAVMVEYRKQGVQAWTPIVTLAQNVSYGRLTVTGSRWSAGYYNMAAGENEPTWVELEAGSANKADHYENAPYKPAVPVKVPIVGHTYWGWHWLDCAEKFYDEISGVTTSGGDTRTVEIGTLNLSYIPQNYCVIDGSTTSPVYRSVSTPQRLDPGQYEVRAARVAPSAGVLTVLDDVWWDTLGEWTYDKFTYPGCALLAIRVEATDELSGSVPLVDCIVSRNSVEVWNPHTSALESRAANCHAWASYDVLHNADYGAGEPGENFDFDDFERWAAWTQSKGWKCNLYLDQTADVATALKKIAATGAGCTIKLGKRHVCIVDSPEQTGVCRFLFTPGNTEADSYSEEYLPVMDRANRLEITYYDEENNYEKTPMIVKTPDSDLSPLPVQSIALDLIGCTARIQAVQIGNMLLKANKYLTLVAKWRAGVDSLGCRIGDVVEVQVFGGGGRIVAATASTARLDTRVDLTGPSAVVVKHADDSMEKKAVTGLISDPQWETGIAYIIGDYISHLGESWRCIQAHTASAQQPAGDGRWWTQTGSGVNIAGAWQQVPALYDLYSFGLEAEATKLMRIINIEKDQDLYKKITAIEYLPQIYNDDMAVTIEVSAPTYQDVRHLSAQEAWSMQGGGSFVMVLSWLGAAIRWQVYYRVTGASSWTLAGETTQPFFLVAALIPGTEYEFCVTTGSNQGRGKTITRTFWGVPTTTNPDGDPIEGAPPVPSGLKVMRQGSNMLLSWNAVDGGAFPITGYDVRVGTTILAINRAERTFSWPVPVAPGTYVFSVRSVNSYGQRSAYVSASIFIEGGGDPGPNPDTAGTDFQDLSYHIDMGWYYFSWRASTDPQIAKYRIYRSSGMAGFAGAQLIGTVLPSSAWTTDRIDQNGNVSSIWGHWFTTQYNPLFPCYYFVAEYIDGTLSSKIKTIVIEILPSVAKISVSVAEPKLSFSWDPVPGATKYLVYYEYGNIGKYAMASSPFIMPIPPRNMKIRITAYSADGRWSLPTEEEVNIAGIYNWNEIVTLDMPSFANGVYVNMAWINGNTVQRPSLAGGTLAAPYAGNINDSDLFNFVFKYDDVVANNFDSTPASWFRSGWWQEKDAYFESPIYDMGAIYTGRFHLTLNRTITIKQLTDAEILPVPVENYEHYSLDMLEKATVGIIAQTQISEDGVAWKPVENGAWVTMRYMRTRISIAEASPLADIQITTGQAFLDVPDLSESKNDVLVGGQFTKAVTFTKGFRAVNAVLCNAVGNATAWPTNITKTGFTINCSVAGSSVYWFAKGY